MSNLDLPSSKFSKFRKNITISLIVFLFIFSGPLAIADSEKELKDAINNKNQELIRLQQEIVATQAQLKNASNKSRTVAGEVSRLENTIKQLNLSIRATEISINKLNLELSSLDKEINNLENIINSKITSMGEILRNIQIQDNENSIIIFLKNPNLSDSVANIQNLMSLNSQLSLEAEVLRQLQNDLNIKLANQNKKKQQAELQNSNLLNRKTIVDDQKSEKAYLLNLSKQEEAIYQEELSELEQRQAEIAAEIEAIEEKLRQNVNQSAISYNTVLNYPVQGGIITQEYNNSDNFAKNTYVSGKHNGLDLGVPVGTPVFAASDGLVSAAANQDAYCPRGAYGKFITIKHADIQLTTLYAHLSRYIVTNGQEVKRGDIIGYSGNTGLSFGPHLHFGVYLDQPDANTFYIGPSRYCGPQMPFGAHVNPLNYLSH